MTNAAFIRSWLALLAVSERILGAKVKRVLDKAAREASKDYLTGGEYLMNQNLALMTQPLADELEEGMMIAANKSINLSSKKPTRTKN